MFSTTNFQTTIAKIREDQITIWLSDVPLQDALSTICEVKGLTYRVDAHLVWISTPFRLKNIASLERRKLLVDVDHKLKIPVSVKCRDVRLVDVLYTMAKTASINIIIDNKILEATKRSLSVEMEFENVPFVEALEAILRSYDLDYGLRSNEIFIVAQLMRLSNEETWLRIEEIRAMMPTYIGQVIPVGDETVESPLTHITRMRRGEYRRIAQALQDLDEVNFPTYQQALNEYARAANEYMTALEVSEVYWRSREQAGKLVTLDGALPEQKKRAEEDAEKRYKDRMWQINSRYQEYLKVARTAAEKAHTE